MKAAGLALLVLSAAPACLADFNPATMDLTVKPQDNFYLYADGGWLKANPIPADHSSWGGFDELADHNESVLHGILDRSAAAKNPGFIEKLVGDFYASGMDTRAIDAAGIAPLQGELDRISGLSGLADIPRLVAELHLQGVGVGFGLASEQDPKNSEMMISGCGQGGLGLPDRDYYLRTDGDSQKLRDKYVEHVVRMLVLAGDSEASAKTQAAAVMRIETVLAKGSKSEAELRDPVANYHLTALPDVRRLSPRFDWDAYLAGIGLQAPAAIDVGQPDFIRAFDAEIAEAPIADWRAYFRWHFVSAKAPFLSEPFSRENFDFYGHTLTGTPKQRDRWKRVLSEIDGDAGEALGQLYVAEAFPPESKTRILAIIANLRSALHDRISHLEWMDDATRAAALRKLDMFGVKVGYPDKWIDYSKLVIDRGPYVVNVGRATEFNVRRDLAKIGKPVDRLEWGITPPTVNAYYNPTMNEIVFAAGILQPPFYDPKANDAVNYGGIGSVIGHEMTHGFDDEGRQFDGKGNLSDWWSPESAKRFKERAAGIVKQFSGYEIAGGLHVNGELTEGENIADLGGLKLAYTALMRDMASKTVEKVDGFTPRQLFFLSFASIWRTNDRPEDEKLQINTDPHSPANFRVNGPLSNLDEFAAAFAVPEGAPMRRSPADRVTIW
ncbi:MAG TPA: M13 family metallopeptidase [Opitutaceae bacterium]|jgi:predicted metalloendopeptidase